MSITFTLIAQALVFLIFILFTAKFVWPPLMQAVEERQKKIADGLAAADKGARALAEASATRDAELKAARAQAQEILAAAGKQATQLVDQAKTTAQSEAQRIKEAAAGEVDREIGKARETLRKQVGELAVAGAAQILKREINAQAHADVLKDLAAKI